MSFSTDVLKFNQKTRYKIAGIIRDSVQDLADEVSTPTARGGLMPVDTGFLRNSIKASTTGTPVGSGETQGDYNEVGIIVANWKFKDILRLGWTAAYANKMNDKYGFFTAGIQRFVHIVNNNARMYK